MVERRPAYQRILLKLSGEALAGDADMGIDSKILNRMALEVGQLVGIGVQVGIVLGGGNLFRGAALQAAGLDRVAGDHMGMLATVMNGLAMRDALEWLITMTVEQPLVPCKVAMCVCLWQGQAIHFLPPTPPLVYVASKSMPTWY